MKNDFDQNIIVAYAGDETNTRSKIGGYTLMKQLFTSINSVRKNWSKDVEIVFIHTKPLSKHTEKMLKELNVVSLHAKRKVSDIFPIANKFLIGETYKGNKDILFLDCDTIIHRPIYFDTSSDMLVAFDALQDISEERYRRLYHALGVDFPSGRFSEKPSYEYYYHDKKDLFPLINTGVYFIKNIHKDIFYKQLEQNFHKTYSLFKGEMGFYFDQICFALTMIQLGLHYIFFPKGYNFICTPRAPYLKDWPTNKIFIEHYAGDNGVPFVESRSIVNIIQPQEDTIPEV